MSGTPGRPLSPELSEQLVSVAIDILAEEGWGRLNSDRVAARARAGKAGIYRRWPSMSALARHAIGRAGLITVPSDTGSLRGDLSALIDPWRLPLNREERAAASLVGAARYDEELRAALDAALVSPLHAAVVGLGERALSRGEIGDRASIDLLCSVLDALLWQRYISGGDGAIPAEQLERLVDGVLLPAVSTRSAGVTV